jgi:hypothetical protein
MFLPFSFLVKSVLLSPGFEASSPALRFTEAPPYGQLSSYGRSAL